MPQRLREKQTTDITTKHSGDNNLTHPRITASQIEQRLVRDEIMNEPYKPLSFSIVLKQKKEMLYVPLDFENGRTKEAFVELEAYVSAIGQGELDKIKQQAPANIFKIHNPLNYQTQVVNGQLEKPTTTATRQSDIRDSTFAEHFVVL